MAPMVSVAARMRTGALVRRHWVATCVLALLAGLAAAVPMVTWAAGRRTAVAIDEFLTRSEASDVLIDFCPDGIEPRSPDELQTCNEYVPSAELDVIRSMPGVRLTARASWTMMLLATSVDGPRQPGHDDPGRRRACHVVGRAGGRGRPPATRVTR